MGMVHEKIIFCVELKGRKTAAVIFRIVRDFMLEHEIPGDQIGSVCTDGARINTGEFTRIIMRLKALSPNLSDIGCFIHRFVLSA